MKKNFVSPTWVSRTVSIIAMAVGLLLFIVGIEYVAANANYYFSGIGIIYMIFGVLIEGLGIYAVVMSTKEKRKMASSASYCGMGWCACESVIAIYVGIYLLNGNGYANGLIELFIGAVFLAATILLLFTGINIEKGKSFLGIGMAGSVMLTAMEGINLILLFVEGNTNPLSYILSAALIFMGVLLILVSIKSKEVEEAPKKAPSWGTEEFPYGEHSLSEQEKVALIKEYKDFLDQGIITQEEFEKKKESLLS